MNEYRRSSGVGTVAMTQQQAAELESTRQQARRGASCRPRNSRRLVEQTEAHVFIGLFL